MSVPRARTGVPATSLLMTSSSSFFRHCRVASGSWRTETISPVVGSNCRSPGVPRNRGLHVRAVADDGVEDVGPGRVVARGIEHIHPQGLLDVHCEDLLLEGRKGGLVARAVAVPPVELEPAGPGTAGLQPGVGGEQVVEVLTDRLPGGGVLEVGLGEAIVVLEAGDDTEEDHDLRRVLRRPASLAGGDIPRSGISSVTKVGQGCAQVQQELGRGELLDEPEGPDDRQVPTERPRRPLRPQGSDLGGHAQAQPM